MYVSYMYLHEITNHLKTDFLYFWFILIVILKKLKFYQYLSNLIFLQVHFGEDIHFGEEGQDDTKLRTTSEFLFMLMRNQEKLQSLKTMYLEWNFKQENGTALLPTDDSYFSVYQLSFQDDSSHLYCEIYDFNYKSMLYIFSGISGKIDEQNKKGKDFSVGLGMKVIKSENVYKKHL